MTWLTNWNHRRSVTISNTGSSLLDYQVLVTIDTSSLISAGKMLSNGNDIRFTSSDGSTLLSYWIESGINTTSTKIWVKIPSILPGTNTIYLYYGNPVASSASNSTDTFQLFDDFSSLSYSPKWTVEQGIWSASTGELVSQASVYETIRTDISGYNREIRIKVNATAGGGQGQNWFYFSLLNTTGSYSGMNAPSDAKGYDFIFYWDAIAWARPQITSRLDNGVGTVLATSPSHVPDNNYHIVTINIYNGSIKYYLDSTLMTSATDNTYNATNYPPNRFYIFFYQQGARASYYDNIIIRNYASPEPTFSSLGEEYSTLPCNTIIIEEARACSAPSANLIVLNIMLEELSIQLSRPYPSYIDKDTISMLLGT